MESEAQRQTLAQYYARQRQDLVAQATCLLHGDSMAAEDVVQATFLRLLQSLSFAPINIDALVRTTMLNMLRDHWRRQHHRYDYEHTIAVDMGSAHADDCFSICSAHQMTELLERKIARMDATVATIMRMNILEEKSVTEMSETLSIRYKTIENCLQAGRRQLRSYFRKVV